MQPERDTAGLAPKAEKRGSIQQAGDIATQADQLGARLPALLVQAEKIAASIAPGAHGRRRPGPGETFWQYRPFAQGDSYRVVDWRRSGRSDALFVRETEWEAAQTIWLWRDRSPSMTFSSSPRLPTKRTRADLITIALAALLLRGGERVGLFGGETQPGLGRAALKRLANDLLSEEEPDPPAGPQLERATELPPKRSHIVLIGDFLEPLEVLQQRLAAYANRGVHGFLCQILDPAERTLPYHGRVRFSGMEEEGETVIDRVDGVRDAYHKEIQAHREALQEVARRLGWTFLSHYTDASAEHALLALYEALASNGRESGFARERRRN